MQIDYFAILRTLYEFKIARQVGAKANSLLLALIWKANVMYFPEKLAIWNSEVRDLAGLSEEELVSARNRLINLQVNGQKVLLYESGGTRRPGKYFLNYQGLITFFQNKDCITPNITPDFTGNVTGNLHSNVGGNPHSNVRGNEDFSLTVINGGSKDGENHSTTYKQTKPTNKQFMSDSLEYELANFMLGKILVLNPNFKKPNMQKWAADMDKILRIDKREVEEVKEVINYIYSGWWKDKILSPSKLREKYDMLNMQRPKDKKNRKDGEVDWGWQKN